MEIKKIEITSEMLGIRIDKVLSSIIDKSREIISDDIKDGHVLVNGKVVKPSYKLEENDEVTYQFDDPKPLDLEGEDLGLEIVYEDDDVAVVNKPSGMVVHPAAGNQEHTLVNGLLYQMDLDSTINGVIRPGIVHRIDKDTSGLLMIAKNDKAMESLSEQLKSHSCNRIYVGLVYGTIGENEGKVIAPIGRDKDDRKKMCVTESGKEAITHFSVLERYNGFTLLQFKLETGRTHQIRVHMKFIGHPLVGDPVYGPRHVIGNNGQYLHAKTIGFKHPTTGEYMEFTSELPEYFTEKLSTLTKREI
ncbi:MAG: RluA family pseudouridine synthase [Acholeplasmatales bacterium]|nr:RluA family pseudouridine synthase [Acholeplasmatales bacterium]